MVADERWMEEATGTLRWRSHRTTVMRDEPSPRVAQFADLYEEHARAVLRYCQLRIADPQEAEDAAARIFTRTFAAYGRMPHNQQG
jgi:DNA-directed RNA polymerase specialized sigma24 family protein